MKQPKVIDVDNPYNDTPSPDYLRAVLRKDAFSEHGVIVSVPGSKLPYLLTYKGVTYKRWKGDNYIQAMPSYIPNASLLRYF